MGAEAGIKGVPFMSLARGCAVGTQNRIILDLA